MNEGKLGSRSGGVLVIPTYEEVGTKAALVAEAEEVDEEDGSAEKSQKADASIGAAGRKSTIHLIERAILRLNRAGGRKSEAESAHLLEGIAVVVYDPDSAKLHPELPKQGLGLRWDEFIEALVVAYKARFED